MQPILTLLLALFAILMIVLMPKVVRLRIGILQAIGLKWASNLLENNFDSWVLFFRAILIVITLVLLLATFAGFRS